MKNRVLYGWSPRRALYGVGGIAIIGYAVIAKEWWGALLGGYFLLMGVFNFGCASGNCGYVPGRKMHTGKGKSSKFKDINFEEVK